MIMSILYLTYLVLGICFIYFISNANSVVMDARTSVKNKTETGADTKATNAFRYGKRSAAKPRNIDDSNQDRNFCSGVNRNSFSCSGHGTCRTKKLFDMNTPYCVCDNGWTGFMCHIQSFPFHRSLTQSAISTQSTNTAKSRNISFASFTSSHISSKRLQRSSISRDIDDNIDTEITTDAFIDLNSNRNSAQIRFSRQTDIADTNKLTTDSLFGTDISSTSRPNTTDSNVIITTVHIKDNRTSVNSRSTFSMSGIIGNTTDNSTTNELIGNTTDNPTVVNVTRRRHLCEGVHHYSFNCFSHGRCEVVMKSVGKYQLPMPRCVCDEGWRGRFCKIPCDVECQNNGRCSFNQTIAKCECPRGFGGELCEMKLPTFAPHVVFNISGPPTGQLLPVPERTWITEAVVGAGVGVFLITVTVLVLAKWKRMLIIRKLVYRFQPYEDDDNMEFDAFISYKSSSANNTASPEELWVINSLMPKLEREMGFKLCIHFRDFEAQNISDNILDAIENSRRTIMVISRAYIEDSFWCRFEYEQAQVAVQERKQRIIPILFEDISAVEITDPILKLILKSITYLEKPDDMAEENKEVDQFWKRMYLSMPKKRTPLREGGGLLTWQESCISAKTDVTLLSVDRSSTNLEDVRTPSIISSGIGVHDLLFEYPDKPTKEFEQHSSKQNGVIPKDNIQYSSNSDAHMNHSTSVDISSFQDMYKNGKSNDIQFIAMGPINGKINYV